MPLKGMRSICFHPRTHSFAIPAAAAAPPPPITTSDPTDVPGVIESASLMIMKWNLDTSAYARVTSLFYESKLEAERFIDCTNNLRKAMCHLVSRDPASEHLVHAHFLMEIAMKRLQKELYQILSMNRAQLDPESLSTRSSLASLRSSTSELSSEEDDGDEGRDSIVQVEETSLLAMNNLKAIADCMISSGYAKECIAVYRIIRKSIVDEGIYRLGMKKTSASHFRKMDWEVMELRISRWLEAVKVSMHTLFLGERILCDHVFANSDYVCGSLFGDIVQEGAAVLFGFPEMVAKIKKAASPEKIFRVLDMYSVIAENWQDIVSIFSYDSTSAVRSQAINSLNCLGESVRAMLVDFEGTLQKDSSRSRVNGGGVHPLTVHTMNYLTLLGDYSGILADIFLDSPSPARSSLPCSYLDSADPNKAPAPAISVRVEWLILILLCKLDLKAKQYKDVSTTYLFLANNLQHVMTRVQASNLQNMLGEKWISEHDTKVRQFLGNYERLAWGQVLETLPDPTTVVSPAHAVECLRKFNSGFERAYRKQSGGIVEDQKLRDEIKGSLLLKLAKPYGEFYEAHKDGLEGHRNFSLFVKFSPEDIRNYVSELLLGAAGHRGSTYWSSPSLSSGRSSWSR